MDLMIRAARAAEDALAVYHVRKTIPVAEVRDMLKGAWLAGHAAGLETSNARLEQALQGGALGGHAAVIRARRQPSDQPDVNWEKIKPLLIDAVKTTGTYAPAPNLSCFEEHLTQVEHEAVGSFLAWVNADREHRHFGWGNLDWMIGEWERAR